MDSGIGWLGSPKWPDFKLYKSQTSEGVWCGSTDTGRPVTPIFVCLLTNSTLQQRGLMLENMDEDQIRAEMRRELDHRFLSAHPNGCPGRH